MPTTRNRKPSRASRTKRLLFIFLCAALIFTVLFGAAALVSKLLHYGNQAIVDPAPQPDEPVNTDFPNEPADDGLIDGLPANTYNADLFYDEDGFRRYRGSEESHVGIDVSAHQQEIDWIAVKAAGVEFAMIRVGYRGYTRGDLELDPYFIRNMDGAIAAGLDVGVYFFSQAITTQEALDEADFVLNWIKGYDLAYPVVFDWEDIEAEARTDNMDMITLTGCAYAFCEAVEKAGYTAGIYFNQRFGYQELNLQSLQDYVFWLAEYNPAPTFTYHFDMWQYSAEGTVDGIDTPVDLNLSFYQKKQVASASPQQ